MASIKAIEGRSVHQIQSGQVIVDLTSVVKELVENSLDAGASKIDIRFKNYGLDSIEVHDDGNGIAPEDFPSVALKHYTSKLSDFEDLDTLQTFGFRGEALSSLCALANVHIITARAQDGAVGHRLNFEKSGKLESTSVTAAQKGTIVSIENIFYALPVRRKELEKNIKREWTKVVSFMYSYACIGVGVRFSLSNQPTKGRKTTTFQTKGNTTTRENIANVFNAKTLAFLVTLDLKLDLIPTNSRLVRANNNDTSRQVQVQGHVSRPAYGEGRQTPDRQMYFVNSRPCSLPQISKVFNEVYKSFNHHQSPFVLANFIMDTNAYDVNVSPDKKTIMLHDQTTLLETLKSTLTELFQNADHTMPQSQLPAQKLPSFKPPTVTRTVSENTSPDSSVADDTDGETVASRARSRASSTGSGTGSLIEDWAARDSTMRPQKRATKPTKPKATEQRRVFDGPPFVEPTDADREDEELLLEQSHAPLEPTEDAEHATEDTTRISEQNTESTAYDDVFLRSPPRSTATQKTSTNPFAPPAAPLGSQPRRNQNSSTQARSQPASQRRHREDDDQQPIPSTFNSMPKVSAGPINDAFARMRSRRMSNESTEITIGGTTTKTTASGDWSNKRRRIHIPKDQLGDSQPTSSRLLSQGLLGFAAPGSQLALSTHLSNEEVYSEHSDSDAELIDVEGSPSFSSQDLEPGTVDHADGELTGGSLQVPDTGEGAVDTPETQDEIRVRDDEIVARLIQDAQSPLSQRKGLATQRAVMSSGYGVRRRDLTYNLSCNVNISVDEIRQALSHVHRPERTDGSLSCTANEDVDACDAETKLSLTIRKTDFERMQIVGQFNLGFILAVRPASTEGSKDELFIIDQHAADEKSNYERLQKTVSLQSQPLVQPKLLHLTAIEEEVVANHPEALKANGFDIDVVEDADDDNANRTYRLLTLPTSRETTFKLTDLEELMHLLSEISIDSNEIPRPRKVQKMLAMRACRSSIMVGKTLTMKQMTKVVQHMGSMEKPWNCPHGRPTMRHLTSLGSWQSWQEGQSLDGETVAQLTDEKSVWKKWLKQES